MLAAVPHAVRHATHGRQHVPAAVVVGLAAFGTPTPYSGRWQRGPNYGFQPHMGVFPPRKPMADTTTQPTAAQQDQLYSPFNARNRFKFFTSGGDEQ